MSKAAVLLGAILAPLLSGCQVGPCGFSFYIDRRPPPLTQADIDRADIGPMPDMQKARLVAKALILADLEYPISAKFVWPDTFQRVGFQLVPNDPVPAAWDLVVSVTAQEAANGFTRTRELSFSYRKNVLLDSRCDIFGIRNVKPLRSIDAWVAEATARGVALDPGEIPAAAE